MDGVNKTITMVGESQTTITVGANRIIMDGVSKIIAMDGVNLTQIMVGEIAVETTVDGVNKITTVGVIIVVMDMVIIMETIAIGVTTTVGELMNLWSDLSFESIIFNF